MGRVLKTLLPVVEGEEGLEKANEFSLSSAVPVNEETAYEENIEMQKPANYTFTDFIKGSLIPQQVRDYDVRLRERWEKYPEEPKILKTLLLPVWETIQTVKSSIVSRLNKEPQPDNPFQYKDRKLTDVPEIKKALTSPQYVDMFKDSLKIAAQLSFNNVTSNLFFLSPEIKDKIASSIDKITPTAVATLTENGLDVMALVAAQGSVSLLERWASGKDLLPKGRTYASKANVTGKGYTPAEVKSINRVDSAMKKVVSSGSDNPFKDVLKQRKAFKISPQDLNLWKGAVSSEGTVLYGSGLPIPRNIIDKYNLTNKQIKDIGKGLLGAIPKEAVSELTKIGVIEPTQPSDLTTEAKKYKSAEEFVAKQPIVYHGTPAQFETFDKKFIGKSEAIDSKLGTFFVSDKNIAQAYAEYEADVGYIKEAVVDTSNFKIVNLLEKSEKAQKYYRDIIEPLSKKVERLERKTDIDDSEILDNQLQRADKQLIEAQSKFMDVTKEINKEGKIAKKEGYKGIVVKNVYISPDDTIRKISDITVAFDTKSITTKSQLTDIWNKAQEGTKPPTVPPQPSKGAKKGIVEPVSKERGFISTVKGELPVLKVAGQYIPRPTDPLAIKAKNIIKDDLVTAQKMALTGTDDASIAVGAELLKKYSADIEAQKDETIKDAIYEKSSELAVSMAQRLTDLGRSIQAASILSRLTPEGQVRFAAKSIQKYNERVEETKGGALGLRKKIPELTPEQTKDILTRMKDIESLPDGSQKAIMFRELQDYITDLVPTPLMDKLITVWKAGLLTGIKTSGLNIFSNIAHAISETVKDFPATIVDIIASVGTGKRSVAFTTAGTLKGTKEGADKGWRFLKTGYDERNVLSKYDYKRVNMGKSKFAKGLQKYEETVFNILGTEDQPFYYGAKMRSLYEQSKVAAINKKLKGKEAQDFIDNLVMNPTDEMALLSIEDAKIAVYQNETALGNLAKKFQNLGAGAHLILPFGRTPSAVATQILNYTPVGAAKTIFTNIGKGKFNQRDFSKGIGRGITGTAALGFGAYLYKQGMISLDRPKTEAERELWNLEGRKPNSIKIGNKWRTVQTFGPLGNVLLIGGHFAKAYEDKGSTIGALSQGAFGGIKSFTEQTFLQSVNRFLDAIDDPKRSAGNFVSSFVSSIVPTLVKDVAVSTDPKVRIAQGLVQKLTARIPILRQILEPRVDVFGRDVERSTNFIESMADPTRPSTVKNDPIVIEIRRLETSGNDIKTTQLGTKFGYKSLSQEENAAMWRESGRIAYERISEFMNDTNYEVVPDDIKAKRINTFIKDAQDNARVSAAIEKTMGLGGEELRAVLTKMVEDKLLTQSLYRKYLRSR